MKATLIFPQDLNAGIQESSVDITIDGIETKVLLINTVKRKAFKEDLAALAETYWEKPSRIILDDE